MEAPQLKKRQQDIPAFVDALEERLRVAESAAQLAEKRAQQAEQVLQNAQQARSSHRGAEMPQDIRDGDDVVMKEAAQGGEEPQVESDDDHHMVRTKK